MADQRQLCTFFLEERFFGIEVERVQEVIRYQTVTPVPLAPAVVRGLINLRGQIVTAIDLRRLLQVEDLSLIHILGYKFVVLLILVSVFWCTVWVAGS